MALCALPVPCIAFVWTPLDFPTIGGKLQVLPRVTAPVRSERAVTLTQPNDPNKLMYNGNYDYEGCQLRRPLAPTGSSGVESLI
jgi:hypothetical protein